MATITKLTVSRIPEIEGSRLGNIVISLEGVDGVDLVGCADEELIGEILDTVGEDAVREHFGITVE